MILQACLVWRLLYCAGGSPLNDPAVLEKLAQNRLPTELWLRQEKAVFQYLAQTASGPSCSLSMVDADSLPDKQPELRNGGLLIVNGTKLFPNDFLNISRWDREVLLETYGDELVGVEDARYDQHADKFVNREFLTVRHYMETAMLTNRSRVGTAYNLPLESLFFSSPAFSLPAILSRFEDRPVVQLAWA